LPKHVAFYITIVKFVFGLIALLLRTVSTQ